VIFREMYVLKKWSQHRRMTIAFSTSVEALMDEAKEHAKRLQVRNEEFQFHFMNNEWHWFSGFHKGYTIKKL